MAEAAAEYTRRAHQYTEVPSAREDGLGAQLSAEGTRQVRLLSDFNLLELLPSAYQVRVRGERARTRTSLGLYLSLYNYRTCTRRPSRAVVSLEPPPPRQAPPRGQNGKIGGALRGENRGNFAPKSVKIDIFKKKTLKNRLLL
jgi:hypothetical protein